MFYKLFIFYAIIFSLFNFFTIEPARIINNEIFNAHRAGQWYPRVAGKLTTLLRKLEKQAQEQYDMKTGAQSIKALVCPHAAYDYSGVVAASVYNLVKTKNFDRVIVLAPSHFVSFRGIALPPFTHYHTPLGTITLDQQTIRKIARHSLSLVTQNAFTPEHSLEMQLPFIQSINPHAQLVPIMVGSLSDGNASEIASLLKQFITPTTLVIVSSDMTHYDKSFGYAPFSNTNNLTGDLLSSNLLLRIHQLDSAVLATIQHQDLQAFKQELKRTNETIYESEPLHILLNLIEKNAFGKTATRLVSYATSADSSLDTDIVSYAGLIVTQDLDETALNKQEQSCLLAYSRATLEQAFLSTVHPELLKPLVTPVIEKPAGVFVTLWEYSKAPPTAQRVPTKKLQKKLRGCMGQVTSQENEPLYKTVANMTHASAFRDPRFKPLTKEELKDIKIEISLLKPAHPVQSYEDIILNKHGIILTIGKASALFLPNVPSEFGFDLTKTLEELSIKAGLDKDAWKLPTAKFHVFETQDFKE